MSWPESFPPELLEKAQRQMQADKRRAAFHTVGEEPKETEEDSAPEPRAERRSPPRFRGGGALAAVALAEDSSDDGYSDDDFSDEDSSEEDPSDEAGGSPEPRARPTLSVVDGSGKKDSGKGGKKELPPYLRVIK
jgi:hypothetical protein